VYVSARLWDSAPPSEWIANEMRRDTRQLRQNDTFGVSFDTYYDRRNAFFFYTNPLGARADQQITNEGKPNGDWNPIWDVRSGRFKDGWSVEMQIPFKSLRYRPGRSQIWGVQLRRAIRRKNEWVHLTQVPRSTSVVSPSRGIFRISRSGTLVGLEAPESSRTLEVKPYAISGLETDRVTIPATSNEGHADVGLDVKLGLTDNLTADFTVNTDFAQVEADEQQVNLTRFEISFPEKREFFLEGRDIYQFALTAGTIGTGSRNTPTLFFSRRIGLQSGNPTPILAGGRISGKVNSFDVGALSIQTGKDENLGIESTNFTALRLRRDILQRSSIGALFTGRSASTVADGSNQTYGLDASLSLSQDFNLTGYYAETRTRGLAGNDRSFSGHANYNGDLLGAELRHLQVGENFNPEVGFLRRRGFRETIASARFSLRPASIEAIRKFTFQASLDYLEHATERFLESREGQGQFQIEFENSDFFDLTFIDSYELLDEDFRIGAGVTIPPGRYSFQSIRAGLTFGLQRWYSGILAAQRGSFLSGDKTTVGLTGGRVNINKRLSLEPTLSLNWVNLPEGSFRSDLVVTRINYAFSPRMFLGGLVQYNSDNDSFSTNLRLRWEYQPGSELFIVYTEVRTTDVFDRSSELSNRGLTVKVNYLVRL